MKTQVTFVDFILKEWLLFASGTGVALTTLYTHHFPDYSLQEFQVFFILAVLFITVNGLQKSGFILKTAQGLEDGKAIPLKLVTATFFLSMLVTNDVALIVMIPLTLSLTINRKDILVILEALAANAGSALTPVGNPQNLFIYWFYHIQPGLFLKSMAPFSLFFLGLLMIAAFFVKIKTGTVQDHPAQVTNWLAIAYGLLLGLVLLTVLHLLPVIAGIVVILFVVVFDRQALRIDYALLFSFLFFFGIADNLKIMLASEISHSGHVFLFSALASQIMSNVPATLLFAKFTSNWPALLWGVNAGGFGSLFGSLANLIAYKLYVSREDSSGTAVFTARFLVAGYVALFISMGLYFTLHQTGV